MRFSLFLVLFVTSILNQCASQDVPEVDFSQPVSPMVYQKTIKQGFSTNYFKSKIPAKKYREKNIQDIYDMGFRNVRLRCRADLHSGDKFNAFIEELVNVVDECLEVGVAPIISWIHHVAEARGNDDDRQNYIAWWTKVAERLKHKSYLLSFNLFTELGVDFCGKACKPDEPECPEDCDESLRENTSKYNQWTREVVSAIRATGGNNAQRILILASPKKLARGLFEIAADIYENDNYMMVEFHEYAAGPSSNPDSARYWSSGTDKEKARLTNDGLDVAKIFTEMSGLLSYFGAWMPRDNSGGGLNEMQVINFAEFFVSELKSRGIPWSMNVLDDYYDTKESQWIIGKQNKKGQLLDMSRILERIRALM